MPCQGPDCSLRTTDGGWAGVFHERCAAALGYTGEWPWRNCPWCQLGRKAQDASRGETDAARGETDTATEQMLQDALEKEMDRRIRRMEVAMEVAQRMQDKAKHSRVTEQMLEAVRSANQRAMAARDDVMQMKDKEWRRDWLTEHLRRMKESEGGRARQPQNASQPSCFKGED